MNAPAIATGAPNPAAPSMNAPKQNATSSNCSRRSGVIVAIDCFMISNCPVSTEMSYRYTAAITIHTIFSSPNDPPYRKLTTASLPGMPNTNIAHRIDVVAPAIAHKCGRIFKPASIPSSTTIGSAATSVESHQCPSGSYTCVQFMFSPRRAGEVRNSPAKLRCAVTRSGPSFLQGIKYILAAPMSRSRSPRRNLPPRRN